MTHVTIAGKRLYYRLSRNDLAGRRPPMVLVHGAGGTHMHWPAQLRRLPETDVYALDLPGHGHSTGPGHSTIAQYRDVIWAFCQALDLRPVVLIGHSMGGAIAQDFALHYPGRLAGLVLVGTGAKLKVAPAILQGVQVDFAATANLIAQWAHGDAPSAQMQRLFVQRLLEIAPQVVLEDYQACNAFDLRADLGRIDVPTLVIGATADRLTPPRYAEYLAEHLPSARLHLVDGAGHMMMLEAPDEVAGAIDGFVSRLEVG